MRPVTPGGTKASISIFLLYYYQHFKETFHIIYAHMEDMGSPVFKPTISLCVTVQIAGVNLRCLV